MTTPPTGTVTFLFTDIEGSTDLALQYPDAMPALLARHHAILREAINTHHGVVFKIIGDAFCAAFSSADEALAASLTAQQALQHEAWSPAPIKVRMGLHSGTAQPELESERLVDYDGYLTLTLVQRIMSTAYGNQVLISNSTNELLHGQLPAGISLRDMGEQRLKGLTHLERLWQIIAPDLISDFPPLKTSSGVPNNLPTQLTTFIGREMELQALETLLGDSHNRVITIVAQGGMGKTRLALQVAAHILKAFPHGVFFIPLDRINSAELIAQSVAEVLPISLATNEDPKSRVLDYLRDKTILLVMDNFEHVLAGGAFAQEMLTAAPRAQILATSRERLNLMSETVFKLGGLTIGAAAVEQNSAIQLFVQSAKRTRPDFELNERTLPAVTRICRSVEGMPLALVLAAAWIDTLTINEIGDEIDAGIDMLETERRDVPDRQHSVRAVIESSWNQIDANAQNQMKRLSAFRGGFTRAAAQETAGATLRSLSQLVDKALLRRDPESGRYSMHELLRQYAQEQLDRSAEEQRTAHESHAKYFADFMQARWTDLRGTRQIAALAEIDAELDNIRAAWNTWLDKQEANRLLQFMDPLWLYLETRTSLHPAIELFEAAAQKLTSTDPEVVCVRALMQARQAWFLSEIGLPELGLAMGQESVHVLREHNWSVDAHTLQSICVSAMHLSKWPEYREASREMMAWAKQHGDAFDQGIAACWFAYTFVLDNQITTAVEMVQHALDSGKRIDNPFLWTWAEWDLGLFPLTMGDTGSAKAYYARGVEQARRISYVRLYQVGYESLTAIAFMENDTKHAWEYALECLRISQQCGQTREMLASLRDLARVYIEQGKLETALRLIAVVLNHPASEQNSLTRPERLRDEAEKLRVQVEAQLPQADYKAAWQAGEKQQLLDVVAQLLN